MQTNNCNKSDILLSTRTDLHRTNINLMFDIMNMVNNKERTLLYGYIRKYNTLLNKNNNSHTIIIPELITITCLWYYVCFDEEVIIELFDDINLTYNLLRGIYHYGLEKPQTICQRAIVPITRYQDVIVHAQSGMESMDKTATIAITSLQMVDTQRAQTQIIVLSQTREIATNTALTIQNISRYLNITIAPIIGGVSVRDNIATLSKGIQIIVGTTGRVYDLISRGALDISAMKLLVIDNADEQFDRGFAEHIYDICNLLDSNVHIAVFSATMPEVVMKFTEIFLIKPIKIMIKKPELTLCGIHQFYIAVEKEDYKFETVIDLFESLTITQCVIYVNTKQRAIWLNDELQKVSLNCICIYGDMQRQHRENILKEFRNGSHRILITTDLMEFGVDLYTMKYIVSLVINYDLPTNTNIEQYICRIGRSGKYGRKGVCINLMCNNEEILLANIKRFYNTNIDELPMDFSDII